MDNVCPYNNIHLGCTHPSCLCADIPTQAGLAPGKEQLTELGFTGQYVWKRRWFGSVLKVQVWYHYQTTDTDGSTFTDIIKRWRIATKEEKNQILTKQ